MPRFKSTMTQAEVYNKLDEMRKHYGPKDLIPFNKRLLSFPKELESSENGDPLDWYDKFGLYYYPTWAFDNLDYSEINKIIDDYNPAFIVPAGVETMLQIINPTINPDGIYYKYDEAHKIGRYDPNCDPKNPCKTRNWIGIHPTIQEFSCGGLLVSQYEPSADCSFALFKPYQADMAALFTKEPNFDWYSEGKHVISYLEDRMNIKINENSKEYFNKSL